MRKATITIFLLLFFFFVSLVVPSWAKQESKDVAPILEQLKKAQESLEDFTADIKQVKISSLFKEPVVSHGKMRLKQPNQLWVEMYPPYPNVTVLNKGVLLIYFPEERVVQRYQVAGNPVLAKWLLFFQNPIETLGKKIWLQEEKEDEVVLGIEPAEDLAIFQEIRISIDTSNWMPKRLELKEKSGDRTITNYLNVRTNVGIPDSSFQLRLPPDVEIIEPMRR
ncbi:MAG: outer membrane lipoprotein carrier protein LolA [Deltaproteobacteria bacterium]|nr:outer membrane lipoprotein carrier protein LolA [Deltaproteobacteria bacterium]